MHKHCGNHAAVLTNYASFLHQKCFSNSPKDMYCQNMNNQKHWYNPILISAGKGVLSTFKILADFCWACSKSISVLSGPSYNIVQVDELDSIGIHVGLELCSCDTQLDHTIFGGKIPYYASIMPWRKSCWLCSNYAGIIFSSLPPSPNTRWEKA